MKNNNFRIITSKQGIEYLESQNMSLKDLSDLMIPSGYGMVYELNNGEILLIHPRGDGEYPGFIFKNLQEFKKACDSDFFPITKEKMTWLERHANEMQNFLKEHLFYTDRLNTELKLSSPFKSISESENAYNKIIAYLNSKKHSVEAKEDLLFCYAMALTKFLIEEKGYSWELKKSYEVYNPYYQPLLINSKNVKTNPISDVFRALGGPRKVTFRHLYSSVSDMPMNAPLE